VGIGEDGGRCMVLAVTSGRVDAAGWCGWLARLTWMVSDGSG
jgi:hypothetical protein